VGKTKKETIFSRDLKNIVRTIEGDKSSISGKKLKKIRFFRPSYFVKGSQNIVGHF
jgi:hypothetical protein